MVNSSLKLLETSDEAYWNEWINNTKGSIQKHFIELRDKCLKKEEDNLESSDTNPDAKQVQETTQVKNAEKVINENETKHDGKEHVQNVSAEKKVAPKQKNATSDLKKHQQHKTTPKKIEQKHKSTNHVSHKTPKKPK